MQEGTAPQEGALCTVPGEGKQPTSLLRVSLPYLMLCSPFAKIGKGGDWYTHLLFY